MKTFILLSLVAVALATRECGENSHYDSCGTACPLTCKNYQNPPKACVLMCNPGCHCDEGYVKTADGRCVAPEECPAETDQVCGENQVFTTCGTACPLTCDNYQNPPKICTKQCIIGCACAKGFVKTRDGRCARPDECPASAPELKSCEGEGETGLCKAYFPSWYYDAKSGQCKRFIYGGCGGNGNRYNTEEECMENCGEASSSWCGPNSHFEKCGSACPLTCFNYKNPPQVCPSMCMKGCQCNPGFVRTEDDRCIRPEECPTQYEPMCGENAFFTTCGDSCPLTCDNYNKPPDAICDTVNDGECYMGCQCMNGYVQTRDGRCVRPVECPAANLGGSYSYSFGFK